MQRWEESWRRIFWWGFLSSPLTIPKQKYDYLKVLFPKIHFEKTLHVSRKQFSFDIFDVTIFRFLEEREKILWLDHNSITLHPINDIFSYPIPASVPKKGGRKKELWEFCYFSLFIFSSFSDGKILLFTPQKNMYSRMEKKLTVTRIRSWEKKIHEMEHFLNIWFQAEKIDVQPLPDNFFSRMYVMDFLSSDFTW